MSRPATVTWNNLDPPGDAGTALAEGRSDTEASAVALLPEEEKIIDHIFGSLSAHQLELITTTDFVARDLCQRGTLCADQDIVDGVKVLKGEKFSPEKICEAITLLKENGYRWD
ncbi:MAG: hypothetical protein GX434_12965 [Peptococcaceae bacterium]|nr:hypothetical protein [Peptococcaceae bacterium]